MKTGNQHQDGRDTKIKMIVKQPSKDASVNNYEQASEKMKGTESLREETEEVKNHHVEMWNRKIQ